MQQELLQKSQQVAEIGKDVGFEAAEEMVKAYFDKHPDQAYGNIMGKEIIESILAQPGCEGILMLPAYEYSKDDRRHMVLVGVDSDKNPIYMYNVVSSDGKLVPTEGIVAENDDKKDVKTYSWTSL
jgi:hypothetical protein